MANNPYANAVLEKEIANQIDSKLDLMQFCTVDNTLEGAAGMKKVVRVYNASDSTQKLAQGVGNTDTTEVDYTDKEYEIDLYQNRFTYYDEEAMKDPMIVEVGVGRLSSGMYNKIQELTYDEFKNAQLAVATGSANTAISFDNFADAIAKFNKDDGDETPVIFGLVHQNDVAKLRKTLEGDLKYVEAFARSGYIGTICGANLYTYKKATEGTIILATKKAVTFFNKTGVQAGQGRDENLRKNNIYSRKYGFPAFTDAGEAVAIIRGAEIAATTTTTASVAVAATVNLNSSTYFTQLSHSPLTWASSAPAKATVSATGVVTGVATGTSNITATTVNGNNVTIAVTVTAS